MQLPSCLSYPKYGSLMPLGIRAAKVIRPRHRKYDKNFKYETLRGLTRTMLLIFIPVTVVNVTASEAGGAPRRRGRTASTKKVGTATKQVTPQQEKKEEEKEEEKDLWKLHQELVAQIEVRKKVQGEITEKLGGRVAVPPSHSAGTQRKPNAQPTTLAFQPASASPPPVTPAHIPDAKKALIPSAPPKAEAPPPPKNPNAMNIVFVGAECAPWSKTGGLGDVMQALPKALSARGHRVMVVAPRYGNYEGAADTGVRLRLRVCDSDQEVGFFHLYRDGVDYVFIDHSSFHSWGHEIYGGSRQEVTFRCALLSKACLEAPWLVSCGGSVYGDDNLMFVANDWHTALVPFYLQAHYRDHGKYGYARCTFILHNIAHQGRAPMDDLRLLEVPDNYTERFRLYDPVGGEHMNIMKAGFLSAHRVVAVSPGYAWECTTQEGGWGLDGIIRDIGWKMRGVVNGIDPMEWNPTVDPFLTSDGYAQYSLETFKQYKAKCKAALQAELGLPVDPNIPLLGFIGRLDYQKGIDLIRDSHDWIRGQGAQLVLLGSGRDDLENDLRQMENTDRDGTRSWVGFSVQMAHRITAGADILLMPSRFEPCGLNQLYAMAYGTVPVVHAVGGLRDTVQAFNPDGNTGTGWTFNWCDVGCFQQAMSYALDTYRNHKEAFYGIQERGMKQDLSWQHAADQYEQVLIEAKHVW